MLYDGMSWFVGEDIRINGINGIHYNIILLYCHYNFLHSTCISSEYSSFLVADIANSLFDKPITFFEICPYLCGFFAQILLKFSHITKNLLSLSHQRKDMC
jgi:hypothetical protein